MSPRGTTSSGQKEQPDPAIQRYWENASPEEQQKFAKTLLDAEARVRKDSSVPPSVIRTSRLASAAIVGAYALGDGLVLGFRGIFAFAFLVAIAWFPNQLARATGRMGVGTAVSRPSHPWVLLIIVWMLLLVFALGVFFGGAPDPQSNP